MRAKATYNRFLEELTRYCSELPYDESFLRSIEDKVEVVEPFRDDWRRAIMTRIGVAAWQGKKPTMPASLQRVFNNLPRFEVTIEE